MLESSPISASESTVSKVEAEFKRLDANNDGHLVLEEAGDRRALIRAADIDGDGGVTLDELKVWLRKRKATAEPDPDAEPLIISQVIPNGSPITEKGCRAAASYAARKNGYSFLVMLDGKIVFERYDQGWTTDTIHRLASGTKSFSAALLAAAVKDSLLTLEEPVSKTLNEWQTDPRLSKITLRQLLSLSSGIDPGDNGKVPSYSEVIEAKVLQPAGEKFAYGPAPFQIFGEVMRRKLKARNDLDFADPLAYLRNRVLNPIGLEVPVWRSDAEGMPHLPSGAAVSAREWVKYGEFLRQEGTWEGKELVDPGTLKMCRRPSQANRAYGLTFWLLRNRGGKTDSAPGLENSEKNSAGLSDTLAGAYMAAGAGKQRLYIIPSRKVVVVRQGESKGVRFDDSELLRHLFGE